MSRRQVAFLRAALVIALTVGGYALIQHPLRLAETRLAAQMAGLLDPGHLFVVRGTSVLETPMSGPAFLAVVTPSCSAAASVASLIALASLIRSGRRTRRGLALLAAVAAVVLGNILRLAAVMAVGLVSGRAALILFHNFAASVFSFAYTMAGFIILVWVVLRERPQSPIAGAPLA